MKTATKWPPQGESEKWPAPNQLYRHYKGGIYRVASIGRFESDGSTAIIYEPHDGYQATAHPWVRSVASWNERVKDVGNIQRFVELTDKEVRVLKSETLIRTRAVGIPTKESK